jgi:LysR family transcriptional regulator, hydrogen peroxide-inducible genes activator
MELSQLRYVQAIAETGNFTRAADKVNISQPSLSQQIINLEREIGHRLFHRLGRKAVLTEAGIVFLERARKILSEVENATKELSDSPTLERRITVGAIPTVCPYLLPPMIEACKVKYPNLQIDVREEFRSDLLRAVLEGEVDLAITATPITNPRLSVEPLMTEPLLLVVAKDHPLSKKHDITVKDIADETFVMLGTSSSVAAQIQTFFCDRQFVPRIGFRCAQVPTAKLFVSQGYGVSLLPRAVRTAADQKTLTYLDIPGGNPSRELAVIRHLQRYQSRGAEQFISLLREKAEDILAG